MEAESTAGRVGVLLFAFLFCVFGLTASKLHFGYEGSNIAQAEAWLRGALARAPNGNLEPYTQGGVLDVAVYVPSAWIKLRLERMGRLAGLQQLVYVPVMPFLTALLCIVFYGLALELYRDKGIAARLTLIAALGTMIWPYAKIGMENQITLWTLVGAWALVVYAGRPTAGAAAWLGAALAAVALTKATGPLHAALLIAAGLWLAWTGRWLRRPGFLRHLALLIGIGLAGLLLLLFSNRWRFGGWLWGGRYGLDTELRPIALWESAWGFLFSPCKSVFLFSPPALVALWFWGGFWRRFTVMRPILIGLLLLTVFHLTARTWIEEVWGARRMHYLVPFLILPLGIWWERRGALRGWVRRIGYMALAFGLWVQAVGILFDYTTLAFTLGFHPNFSQEHYLWDPQYNHIRFNLHLLASARHRAQTGETIPYTIERHYIPANYDGPLVAEESFAIQGRDGIDLWYLQQAADWPGRPYWFSAASSWLVILLAIGGVTSICLLIREMRRS